MIRKYHENDADAVVSVWREATKVAHPFLPADFVESEAEALRNTYLKFAKTWVIEVDNTLVGFIAMLDNEVAGLFLRPTFHGQGLGRAMVDFAFQHFGPLQVDVFENNTIGRRFYHSYGFAGTQRYVHKATGETVLKLTYPAD